MSKTSLSFSDFVSEGSPVDDELEQVDDNKDQDVADDLQDKTKKAQKKADKKQLGKKDEPIDTDTDIDDQDPDEDVVQDKSKTKKVEPKVVPEVDKDVEPEIDQFDPEEASKFFEEVEKITGTELEVDYGDINPLSPQGVALREKALKESTLDAFLEEIEAKFPQAFKALQHAYAGGNVSELFTQTTSRDYSKVELKEGDDTLAKEILKEYYKANGVKNEAKIAKLIETDEDSEGGLIKEAQTALTELRERQDGETSKVLEAQKQQAAEQRKKDQILVTAVDEVLESKKLGSFRITDRQDASDFKKFVMSSLRRSTDGYELVTPVNSSDLEKQLQYAYFQYKKGDLSKMVQQKASTENAKKLQLRLSSEQQKQKKTTEQENKNTLTMKDFFS